MAAKRKPAPRKKPVARKAKPRASTIPEPIIEERVSGTGQARLAGERRPLAPEELDERSPEATASRPGTVPMPANCRRVLNTPRFPDPLGGCHPSGLDCEGLQRDGSCLTDIVRATKAQGLVYGDDWVFEIDPRDGVWCYEGPELEHVAPQEPLAPEAPPTTHSYLCPHCQNQVSQVIGNWWCPKCGKNANDE